MFKQLQRAFSVPRMIMTVNADNGDGTIVASTGGGSTITVIGSATPGTKVYVQDGRVLGSAPDLPHTQIEV